MLSHKCNRTASGKADPVFLRDDHIVLLAIDGLLAAHAAINRWFKRWRTRQLLAALDKHQLRDIGLTRADVSSWSGRLRTVLGKPADVGDISRRALADLDDSELGNLSDLGRQVRRDVRRACKIS